MIRYNRPKIPTLNDFLSRLNSKLFQNDQKKEVMSQYQKFTRSNFKVN